MCIVILSEEEFDNPYSYNPLKTIEVRKIDRVDRVEKLAEQNRDLIVKQRALIESMVSVLKDLIAKLKDK